MSAILAVREMHHDSSRLLRDLDKEMIGYKSVYGSVATTDLSYDIKRGAYMSEGLLRHWVINSAPNVAIGVNILFWSQDKAVTEPLFIVAKLLYLEPLGTVADRNKAWDPWNAYLLWNTERKEGVIIEVKAPQKRPDLQKIAVAAVPLFTIDSEARAREIVQRVRDFSFA